MQDLLDPKGKGRSFAFGDKGSTSGYLIPLHFFMQQGIDPEQHFGRVLYTKHQAIETQVAAGPARRRRRLQPQPHAMIDQGLIKAERSKVIWQSPPLPNDAVAVSAGCSRTRPSCASCRRRWSRSARCWKPSRKLLPANYTGFVAPTTAFYKPIRDAGPGHRQADAPK
jgi:phosphonate transport system substrate-binding protein